MRGAAFIPVRRDGRELQISPPTQTDIAMASFGSTSMTHQKLGVATIEGETLSGELIPMSVLIVLSIAAPSRTPYQLLFTICHIYDI